MNHPKLKVLLFVIASMIVLSCGANLDPTYPISNTPEAKYVFPLEDFDATQISGTPQWTFDTDSNINAPIGSTGSLVLAIVANGQTGSKLLAIKVEDGTLAWYHDIDGITTGEPISHG